MIFLIGESGSRTPPSSPQDSPKTNQTEEVWVARMPRRPPHQSPEKGDPLVKLLRFLKPFYREIASRDPMQIPSWAPQLPPSTLCPANFQPALQLAPVSAREIDQKHETIRLEQLLTSIRTTESYHEAPRRVLIEGGPGSGKTSLSLKILNSWATNTDWNGPSVQLALFVPLRELRGVTIMQYLSKELLPKNAGCSTNFLTVWKTLNLLEDRLLFILDGYDEAIRLWSLEGKTSGGGLSGKEALGDAVDLIEGRLFPDSRLIITSSPGWISDIAPYIQRRVVLNGLDWAHVQRLTGIYFINNKQDYAKRLLDTISANETVLKSLACWPLGWLLLCVLYEEDCCYVPTDVLDLHQALFKCLIRRSLAKRGDIITSANISTDLPGHCKKLLAEFGRLALICIKEDRFLYTDTEIRIHCRTGGLEITELGFLIKGLNFGKSQNNKKKPDYYSPIHRSFSEFLAAYYLSSVVHYANILRREMDELPGFNSYGLINLEPSATVVLNFLMGLLGRKGYLVFSQFCPLDLPTKTLFMLLRAAGWSDQNVSAVGRLLGATGGPLTAGQSSGRSGHKVPVQVVHTASLELEGWANILKSEACCLEAIELNYQFQNDEECEELLEAFFTCLAQNDSVRIVKITSLLGHDFSPLEIEKLASYVKTTLCKPRLHTFEMVVTCLDDNASDRFQSIVAALCETLEESSSPSLNKLVLDLNLSTEEVERVCRSLESASQVTVLHLPHLGCGREGLRAVADLIRSRPLVALNLAGSWGMRPDDQPSSSGASFGSGSGSSAGVGSGTNTLQPVGKVTINSISPKTSSSYYFSSLPRGVLGAYNSLSRPATLPRQPLHQIILDGYGTTDPKRTSDSILFQRLFHPMPSCDPSLHIASGFHDIFEAIRDPCCKLRNLNVSKCLLNAEDALCLGETVRKSRCLDALRLEGGTRLGEVLPVLLGLAENTSLQLLDLGSHRLTLEDGPTQLVCQALIKNSSLRLLSLEGWTFKIEEEGSLAVFLAFLQTTSVRDLVLANCRLHLTIHDGRVARLGRQDDSVAELLTVLPHFMCPGIIFLRLGGFQVTINDKLTLQGPHLLPFLRGFTRLNDLDLSLDKSSDGLVIDDKTLINFFQTLSLHFRTLQSLKIAQWRIRLDDCERTLRTVGRCLKTCSLTYLKVNSMTVIDTVHRSSIEHLFLQTVITNLNYLSWINIVGMTLSINQAACFGKTIRERFPGTVLEISAKDIGTDSIKTLIMTVQEGNKIEVTFLGGPSFNFKLQRLIKTQKFKGKFRRFTSMKE